MELKDLYSWCKIKNKLWYELIIDKLIDDEIYTSWWNMPLKKFDRLRWTKSQIKQQMETLSWILLDNKIYISKIELQKLVYEKIWRLDILEFQSTEWVRNDSDIIEHKLNAWDIIYWPEWFPFDFIWYASEQTLLKITNSWKEINMIVPNELLGVYSFRRWKTNTIKLVDVAMQLYEIKDTSLFCFTD